MEEMNGRCIGSHPRPLKVLIAHSRDQGSKREMNEEERLLRLFVVVPRTMPEPDVREHFSQFGDIDYVSVVRDKNTKESKGFAYVKYHRVSHAAKAFEGCDRSFKPIFADPKPKPHTDTMERFNGPGSATSGSTYDNTFVPNMDSSFPNPEGCTRLNVIASPILSQNQLWQLFDLVPGLDFCHLRHDPKSRQYKGQATVVYNCPQAAAYAKEKLHGFEYPPGQRLIVNAESSHPHNDMPTSHSRPVHPSLSRPSILPSSSFNPVPYPGSTSPHLPPNQAPPRSGNLQTDLVNLAETIAHATSLIQAAGLTQVSGGNSVAPQMASNNAEETYDPSYCSVKLPGPQPLAAMDASVAERLFIVCHPVPPPIYAMKDVFGRFGSLIDIFMLVGKNYGYAKYANKEAAEQAKETLHGQELCGVRLKVMPADPPNKADTGRKRLKMDDQ